MRKIKILFLINNLHRGGAERNFLNQANALLSDSDFDVRFGTVLKENNQNSFQKELRVPASKNVCFGFKNFFDFGAWLRFISFLTREKFDVIYSTLFFANFINRVGCFFTLFNRTKSIVREANVADIKPAKEILADRILSLITKKILAVSKSVADSLAEKGKIPRKKIAVIHNGVKMPEFLADKNEVRRKFNIKPDDFVFLNSGMMKTRQKGHEYLIEAFDLLNKGRDSARIKLFLIGDGPKRQELENLVDGKGLASKVIFGGFQEDVNSVYQSTNVFVLSSLWEGCPNVLLEAMINKLPVIATNVGGVNEIISHMESGYLIEPEDISGLSKAMAFMLENPQISRKLAESGFGRATRDFSFEENLEKLKTVFVETSR